MLAVHSKNPTVFNEKKGILLLLRYFFMPSPVSDEIYTLLPPNITENMISKVFKRGGGTQATDAKAEFFFSNCF